MPSGAPGKAGSQFDLTNKFHSQGLAAGGSAVLDAINRGKVHLAKFILDAGEQDVVNTRDFKGKTPLIRACYIKVKANCISIRLIVASIYITISLKSKPLEKGKDDDVYLKLIIIYTLHCKNSPFFDGVHLKIKFLGIIYQFSP